MDQFSEDVRLHLAGLPVLARKDTWGYRTTKFVRRNRAVVGAGVLTFVVLVAGSSPKPADYELRFALALAEAERADALARFARAKGARAPAADLAAAEADYRAALAICEELQKAGTFAASDQGYVDRARTELARIRSERAATK